MLALSTHRRRLRVAVRRAVARVAAGAVVTVGASTGLVVMSGVAEAHTGSLTAVAVCVPETGTYTVTYSGATSNVPDSGTGHTATLTVGGVLPASGTTITGAPATLTGNTTYSYRQTGVPGTATGAATTAFLVWGNGVTSSPRATITLAGTCGKVVTPEVVPSMTQSVCAPPSTVPTTPTYTIPATTGVVYHVGTTPTPAGTYPGTPGTTLTVTAHALPGFTLAPGAQTIWLVAFTPAPDCATHVDPVQPSVNQSQCTGPGTASGAYLTIPATVGVTFSIAGVPVGVGNHTLPPGTYTVTATALPGYTLDGTSSWHLTIDPLPDCTTHVKPAVGSISVARCTGPGTSSAPYVTIIATKGVVYAIDGVVTAAGNVPISAGSHTVTATAAPGYTLEGPTTWPLDTGAAPICKTTVLAVTAPAVATAHCESGTERVLATYTVPARVGVDYFVGGSRVVAGTYEADPKSVVHVTARARTGFELAADAPRRWDLSFGAFPDCVLGHDEQKRDLPVTGGSTGLLTLAGLTALAAGGALTALGGRCRTAGRAR